MILLQGARALGKRFARTLRGCLAVLALAAGCHRQTPVDIGIRDQILHVGNSSEPRDLDPAIAVSTTESNILNNLFEGLVNFSPDCRSVVPGAAERWEISADGTVYTFHLRPDLRWSNGDPLTSADFLYSFRRILEPKLGAELAIYGDWLVGGQDYRSGRTQNPTAIGFAAPDPLIFVIHLKGRTPFFLGLLATNPFFPVHRATIEKYHDYLERDGAWTKPGRLVSNGAFRLTAWRLNDAVVAEKNPEYWNAAQTHLKEVYFHPIDNLEAEERAFRGGLLHITRHIPSAKLPVYKREHPTYVFADPLTATRYITLNVSRPPFNDVRVRRAFAYAVDRAAIVADVMRDGSRLADSLSVPGSGPDYNPETHLLRDPARARALLAEAGFAGGAGLPPLALTFTPAHQGEQQVVEALQAMWSRELGAHVDLVAQEEKVWLDTLRTKNFQLLADGWSSGVNDPVDLLQMFVSDSPNNDANFVSAPYDAAYAAAGNAATDAERVVHLQEADSILIEQLPIIPLYHDNMNYLVHPAVHGWTPNILGIHLLNAVSFATQTPGK